MPTDNLPSNEGYWFCPLYGFNYDGEQADLPEGLKITKIPHKFVEYLDRNYPDTLPAILSEAKWVIAIKIERIDTTDLNQVERFHIGFAQHEIIKYQLFDLITALRLYQKGRIVTGILTSATFRNSEWSIGGSTIWTSVSNIIFFIEEPTYELRQLELQKFISLFQQIRQLRASGIINNIEIALDRFHSGYHGPIEDRLIDQMIAFESLYLGNEQELTYKLAMRTAFLLRKRKDHRKIVFTNIKKAYNFRSRIVHGDNPPTRHTLRMIVPKTEDYLRQSIKKFLLLLSRGNSLKEIRENLLDENIIKNGRVLIFEE